MVGYLKSALEENSIAAARFHFKIPNRNHNEIDPISTVIEFPLDHRSKKTCRPHGYIAGIEQIYDAGRHTDMADGPVAARENLILRGRRQQRRNWPRCYTVLATN